MDEGKEKRSGKGIGGNVVMSREDKEGGEKIIIVREKGVKWGKNGIILIGKNKKIIEINERRGKKIGKIEYINVIGEEGKKLVKDRENRRNKGMKGIMNNVKNKFILEKLRESIEMMKKIL